MAWRQAGSEGQAPDDRVGRVDIDWLSRTIRVRSSLPAPGRAHGLTAMPDGGFVAVAMRPGTWLLRADDQGREICRLSLPAVGEGRTLDGHAELSGDGQWLLTTETDVDQGRSWISIRDPRTLRVEAAWPLPGRDAHQMLLDEEGALFVAVGGIPRDRSGRKHSLEDMEPALLRLDPETGAVTGRWTLPDPRLSLRHLAWGHTSPSAEGRKSRVLAVGLQAEHDAPIQRAEAPALAVWRDDQLHIVTRDAQSGGYVGDIAAAPDGGFILSAEKQDRCLWWQPTSPSRLSAIASMEQVCALATWSVESAQGLVLLGRRGAARWQPDGATQVLAWPEGILPDNHAVVLS